MSESDETNGASEWWLLVVGVALALAIGLLLHAFLGFPASGADDADITMVYARNLAHGFGYVYQPGGERVEGSTSPLWTFVCAAWLSFGESLRPLFLASAVFGGVACGGALSLARAASTRPIEAFGATILLLAGAAAYHVWASTTLMDVAIWSMFVTLAPLAFTRAIAGQGTTAGVLCSAGLTLCRPESILLGPLLVIAATAVTLAGLDDSTERRAAMQRAAVLLSVIAALVVASAGARLLYFGYALPNTYYVKVGSSHFRTFVQGSRYLLGFLVSTPHAFILVCLTAASFWFDARKVVPAVRAHPRIDERTRLRGMMTCTVLLGAALRLLEGADHFAGFRVLQPFVPVAAALGAAVLSERTMIRRRERRGTLAALVALIPLEWWICSIDAGPGIRGETEMAMGNREIAASITKAASGGQPPSLGVVAAGGVAVDYQGRIYDLMGLNWTRMAHATRERTGYAGHAAFSADVFWEARPELVVPDFDEAPPKKPFRSACDVSNEWYDLVLRGLLSSERFRQEYLAAWIPGPDDERVVTFFVRRDFDLLARLPSATALEWPSLSVGARCE